MHITDQTTKEQLLTSNQAAAFLGVSNSFLPKDRVSGKTGIPFIKIGSAVRYCRSDLEKFIEANTFQTTSEADAA